MAGDVPVTKRLIISGLTPSITAEDISRRLASFGAVKAADGFGLLDGVGQPRKFGYVTLETTTGKLAKCMNLLSGSTWKGAKLRFGEAKPDFRERIALENQKAAEEPPKKKRKRHSSAIYAEDMSIVTPENAATRPGWKVSPLGRITRPIKMRPAHPLVAPQEEKKASKHPKKGSEVIKVEKKKKKRVKDPDTRARRRVIDMTKYGSTHLKGMFLDLEVTVPANKVDEARVENAGVSSSSESEESEEEAPLADVQASPQTSKPQPSPTIDQTPQPLPGPSKTQPHRSPTPSEPGLNPSLPESAPGSDIQQEKLQTLNLLKSLFGNHIDDDDDWAGRESVGSDIDADELTKGDIMLMDGDDEPTFEVVPKKEGRADKHEKYQKDKKSTATKHVEVEKEGDEEDRMDVDHPQPQSPPKQTTENVTSAPKTTLKDLFAPREEEGGFSLLGHLDPDIELDEDLSFLIEQPAQGAAQQREPAAPTSLPTHIPPSAPISLPTQASQAPLVLDPKRPLFFPIRERDNFSKARQRDVFDLIKDNGWYWRDPNVGFFRSSAPNAEEEIKKRWEEVKVDLTRDWKRRHREAGKVSRRKRGGVEDGEY